MIKNLFCLIIIIFVFSCKKSDKPQESNPPAVTKTTYTVDSVSTQPGLILTLKASQFITKDTCTVLLAGKPVLLVQTDSLHYAFFVPVLAPGTYKLDLKTLDAENNPEVVIRNYSAISNSDQVITAVMNQYNDLADSMAKNSFNNLVTSTDATFMHQLMDQLSQNLQSCSNEDRLMLAYQLQNMELDDSSGQKEIIDTTFLALRKADQAKEVSQIMTGYAINGSRKTLKAIGAVAPLTLAIVVAVKAPKNPATLVFTLSAVVVAMANLYSAKESAAETNGKAVSIAGVALDNVSEVKPDDLVVSTGKTVYVNLRTFFRTLRKSDESSPLNTYVTNFIKVMSVIQEKDITLKLSFDDLKSRFGSYFSKINVNYSVYVSPVLTTAKEKTEQIKNTFVTVTNVSNPDITVASVDDGANGLKLSFSNPSNNITTEANFAFTLTYTQEAINNKVSLTKQAKFIPLSIPKVTTTVISAITQTTASSGGIITSDGGSSIVSKGICYGLDANPVPDILNTVPAGSGTGSFVSAVTGLQAGKTYHLRAFAANSSGFGYGNDLSFTTASPTLPTLTTNSVSSITQTTSVSGGNISNDGGANVTTRGICWSTLSNPSVALSTKTNDGTGTGIFSSALSGLTPNTQYYVKSFATNSAGTAYGNEVSFTTTPAVSIVSLTFTLISESHQNVPGYIMASPTDPNPIYEAGMDYVFDTQNSFSVIHYSQTGPPYSGGNGYPYSIEAYSSDSLVIGTLYPGGPEIKLPPGYDINIGGQPGPKRLTADKQFIYFSAGYMIFKQK